MYHEVGLNEETNKNSHVSKELESRDFDYESRQQNPVRATSFHYIFDLTSAVVTVFTLSFCFRLTYLLTPWSRVFLEKLTGSAASQEIPRIFGA